jgi:hypothetical protein
MRNPQSLLVTLFFVLTAPVVVADPGIYIAAGHGGHRMSSNDGKVWTNHEFWGEPKHNQEDLKAIAAGNGICVVVGGYFKSNILVTTDGVNWEQPDFNMGVLSGVIFHEGRFLAFGEGGKVAESQDGLEWEIIGDADARAYGKAEGERLGTKAVKVNIRKWREAGGTFVGAGDNGIKVSTQDFENWHFGDRIEPLSRLMLASDGEKTFVAVGKETVEVSHDGKDWNQVDVPLDGARKFTNILHDGERFILTNSDDKGWESADGEQWTAIEGATFPRTIEAVRPDLLYSFEIYWKFTNELLMSTDGGKSWTPCQLPAPAGITCIVHADEIAEF